MMDLKEARKFLGMTQQDVEDEFDIPRRTLQNWEQGSRNCPEYVEEHLLNLYADEHFKRRTEEWLNERWSIIEAHGNKADEHHYQGAIEMLQWLGYDWERTEKGNHIIFKRRKL